VSRNQRRAADTTRASKTKEDSEPESPSAEVDSPDAEDDDADAEAQIMRENDQSEADMPVPKSDVCIIDLHTKNPLVSYNNQIYSCKWAENIGTELLFTPHDGENPLPSLKTLPGDVDLLAASSARLVSTAVKLEKKEGVTKLPVRPEVDISKINPILSKKLGVRMGPLRREQGQFLDSLIKMKVDKGEQDRVTVIAQKRQTPQEWKEDLRKKRNRERVKLRKDVREGNRLEAELAKERLWEMEQEDEKMDKMVIPEPEKRCRNVAKGEQKPVGRKRNREGLGNNGLRLPARGSKGKGVMIVDSPMQSEGMSLEGFGYGYDAPTPEIPVYYGDEMFQDEYQAQFNGQYDGLHEEDAEGEEDDTQMYGGIYD
jgi:hypothetical protein